MANNGVAEPHLQPTPVREPIYCGCCGTAILAERVDDSIVIKTRRNGRFHVAVVQLTHGRASTGHEGQVVLVNDTHSCYNITQDGDNHTPDTTEA